jgi:hypothetical protein
MCPPKCRLIFNWLDGVISLLFIITSVRTSNSTGIRSVTVGMHGFDSLVPRPSFRLKLLFLQNRNRAHVSAQPVTIRINYDSTGNE